MFKVVDLYKLINKTHRIILINTVMYVRLKEMHKELQELNVLLINFLINKI